MKMWKKKKDKKRGPSSRGTKTLLQEKDGNPLAPRERSVRP